eukprot:TRINITY_DN1066_c0_g1_i1.p2 TRINITY_DN1066_c0_g1~~TRINITY_DN1066_c0_g1_i1.p2  ORF type:complete len:217 (+),score=26.26 TRINITY_DN1066_c0_g1_i1:149-799(+)
MGFLDNLAGQDQARRYGAGGAPQQQQSSLLPSDDDQSFQPSRVYNPYEGLSAALDNRLRKDFTLPDAPEFIFTEEAVAKRRSWSENLTYYTGVGYLGGALIGGILGFMWNFQHKPQAGGDSLRFMVNRFLNTTGRTGRAAGNAFGVLGLFFSGFESFILYMNDGRIPDELGTVAAGFCTGALYRSTRGLKASAITGGVGAIVALALLGGRQKFPGL